MRLLIVFLAVISSYWAHAQSTVAGKCRIKGRVIDSVSRKAVDYATIAVFPSGGGNAAGGMITDEKGTFSVDNLPPGAYTAKIDFVGYTTRTLTGLVLGGNHTTLNLGDVTISPVSKRLEEVTVTGSRNFMENHLDKFVYNVDKDVTSQGGVATDVLKKIPQVSMDINGNVELLGNGNIRVFINGKPSSMFDNNLADALQSIPSNQIQRIEIITSPGAQYDSQGTGGIINIVLKENDAKGINGNVSASGGTRLENFTGNLHVKSGGFEMSVSLLGNWTLKGTTLSSLDRKSDNGELIQTGRGTFERIGSLPQVGIGWDIDKYNSITAGATFSYLNMISTGHVDQDNIQPSGDTQSVRDVNNNALFRSTDVNMNYRRKFRKEGQQLNFSAQWNASNGAVDYHQTELMRPTLLPLNGGTGTDKWRDYETYIALDYDQPVAGNMVLSAGAKGTFSRINDQSAQYLLDTSGGMPVNGQSNNFLYNRNIYAAYLSATFSVLKDYQLKLGLRDEETTTDIPGSTLFYDQSYNYLAPSAVISRKMDHNQTLKVSYSKRLQRPGFRTLNPFVDASDPKNLVRGNPALKPEKVDNVELSYYKFFDKGNSILVTLYEKYQVDDNQTYIMYDSSLQVGNMQYNNVAVVTTINASIEQMAGINISGKLALSQKFELSGSVILFNKHIISQFDSATYNSNNYRINGNASYLFSPSLSAEAFYSFNSARTEVQGKFPAYTNYSFAIRKLFFNKKLGIALTTNDPFNEYLNQYTDIHGHNFSITIDRKVPNRSFGLSANYKFGKLEFKDKKPEHNDVVGEEN